MPLVPPTTGSPSIITNMGTGPLGKQTKSDQLKGMRWIHLEVPLIHAALYITSTNH